MTEVIIIKEPIRTSIARDIVSTALAFMLIAPGVALGSTSLQVAGLLAFVVIVLKWARQLLGDYSMTIPEARRKLDELDGRP